MDTALVSALSALAGSVIGGLTSGATTWLTQRAQARATHLAHHLSHREELYRDFIVAASKTYGDAMMHDEPKIEDLVTLYAMISRMRIVSAVSTVVCAERLMFKTMETYAAPNKTLPEIDDMMRGDADMDPLKDFAEAARQELSLHVS